MSTPGSEQDSPRGSLVRRLAIGVVVALAAVALAILPGRGTDTDSRVERTIASSSVADEHPPTLETVQSLASRLSDAAADGYDQPIDPDRVASVVTSPGEYQALGQLQIPAIGLDVEMGNGVDPVTLERGPGHWTGTPMPGEPGNSVVSGHRTTHTAPFRDLDQLAEGDEITVTTAGRTVTYVVSEVLVVPVEDYTTEVLTQPTDPSERELTLFACHPEGALTHRIVVHAEVVSPDES